MLWFAADRPKKWWTFRFDLPSLRVSAEVAPKLVARFQYVADGTFRTDGQSSSQLRTTGQLSTNRKFVSFDLAGKSGQGTADHLPYRLVIFNGDKAIYDSCPITSIC